MDENGKRTLKDIYNDLNPAAKKIANVIAIIVGLILLYAFISLVRGGDKKIEVIIEQPLADRNMISDEDRQFSDRIAIQRDLENFKRDMQLEIGTIRAENELLKRENTALSERMRLGGQDGGGQNYPPPPDFTWSGGSGGSSGSLGGGTPRQMTTESVGGVRRISGVIPPALTDGSGVQGEKFNYFPTTTYLKGTLLNGLYAPTLARGRSMPHPAFIRIEDLSILPNNLPKDIEGCEFMGEAYGELMDSRVHIRLTKMACTAYDGSKYFDDNVKGVVMGEDGTLGVPGVVRANFNKLLAHSFFMESMAGLGRAIQSMSTTTVIGADGTAQQYVEGSGLDQSGKIMMASAGQGLGAGFQRIAEFYLDMLNEMSPVIQIHGGRNLEIKLTEGVELKLQPNSWSWGDVL